MFMFALIGLSLVLLGIAGLQFSYLFYIERLYRERQKYVQMLEHKNARLGDDLDAAEARIREQSELIASMCPESIVEDEAWADVIEDR
jgi:hypothetical protein